MHIYANLCHWNNHFPYFLFGAPADESNRKQLKLGCEESSPPPADRKFSERDDVENPLDSSPEEGDAGELSPRTSPSGIKVLSSLF